METGECDTSRSLHPHLSLHPLFSILCSPGKTAGLTVRLQDVQSPESPAGIVDPSTFLKEREQTVFYSFSAQPAPPPDDRVGFHDLGVFQPSLIRSWILLTCSTLTFKV